ncbi:MAG: hypothetical protein ABSE76_01515 [Minisyncoccia bacterium]
MGDGLPNSPKEGMVMKISSIEYALIAALIAIFIIASLSVIGTKADKDSQIPVSETSESVNN